MINLEEANCICPKCGNAISEMDLGICGICGFNILEDSFCCVEKLDEETKKIYVSYIQKLQMREEKSFEERNDNMVGGTSVEVEERNYLYSFEEDKKIIKKSGVLININALTLSVIWLLIAWKNMKLLLVGPPFWKMTRNGLFLSLCIMGINELFNLIITDYKNDGIASAKIVNIINSSIVFIDVMVLMFLNFGDNIRFLETKGILYYIVYIIVHWAMLLVCFVNYFCSYDCFSGEWNAVSMVKDNFSDLYKSYDRAHDIQLFVHFVLILIIIGSVLYNLLGRVFGIKIIVAYIALLFIGFWAIIKYANK